VGRFDTPGHAVSRRSSRRLLVCITYQSSYLSKVTEAMVSNANVELLQPVELQLGAFGLQGLRESCSGPG
jgi:hypothetical protein